MQVTTAFSQDVWTRRYHEAGPDAVRLICFPHAGGSASFYFPVSRALAPRVEVLAVQYPGRQERRRDPAVTSIHELADQIAEALPYGDGRPTAFFGHSMGATLAFEVTHRLERGRGLSPLHVFASGRRAPSRIRVEDLHERGDDAIVAELRRLSATDDRLLEDQELLGMILPALRSDYRAIETYRARPDTRLRCPLTVLVGTADPLVTPDEAEAWRAHTTGPTDVRYFPGGHFYLSERMQDVLAVVTEVLTALPR
ncbi:thioesterase II family protein [Micromonospora narathiwatensis]|uniref:Surfactin synthase thioesterase subunit n=1 Tax=Micromonospora narathiwatensis TaxID=299146 RepID=A0A1A8ZHD6_9ACTN|nr:alpha/beta fold hydrolase [Micromonospora narathiwatensis]SBT43449.1 Surfactin synthase thioesterase subunit [Micromonospora narathiwatensis]